MSIFEFHYYELDNAIDERIERSNNIRDEWGTKIFDSEGRLRSSEDFPLEPYTLLWIIQYQQEQITELSEFTDTLSVNSKIDSSAVEMLLERVKVLEKDNDHNEEDKGNIRREISKLKTAFNSDISSLDIRIEGLEKEVEKL